MMGDVVRGKPQQPPTHACEVIYSDIHDLPGLAALLHGHVPGNPAVVDLQGRTLSGTVNGIYIRTPGVILKHGILCVAPKVLVVVAADDVQLKDMTIARTTHMENLPAVCIEAKGVLLELCRASGVYIKAASSARLQWCILSGSPGCGLSVQGPGSHVEVQDCDSCSNRHTGFTADGVGAVMRFSGRCKATNNGMEGFAAHAGGRMTCSDGCVAQGNHVGFLATDHGSRLIAGHGCRAERNTAVGFQAKHGAGMALGDRCDACNNGKHGFDSDGAGTQLCMGKGCRSVCNGMMGVVAYESGKVVTGQGCIATSNQSAGFSSLGDGSILRVGGGSRAALNIVSYSSGSGGVLEVGQGCQSMSVSGRGGRVIMVSGKLGPNPPGELSVW